MYPALGNFRHFNPCYLKSNMPFTEWRELIQPNLIDVVYLVVHKFIASLNYDPTLLIGNRA